MNLNNIIHLFHVTGSDLQCIQGIQFINISAPWELNPWPG